MPTAAPPTRARVPGLELRLERVRHGLRQADVAGALGVSPRRVSTLETLASVAPEAADRYTAAVRKLADQAT